MIGTLRNLAVLGLVPRVSLRHLEIHDIRTYYTVWIFGILGPGGAGACLHSEPGHCGRVERDKGTVGGAVGQSVEWAGVGRGGNSEAGPWA